MTRVLAIWTAAVLLAWRACAADLEVQLRDRAGAGIQDAVVSVRLIGRATPAPKIAGPYAVDQQDLQFHPFVTLVPVGARVSFLNHDATRHHVYSFSPAKRFELKLEKRQQDRAVVFDKAGVVPLGCNIHDRMIAFLDVVDTPWAEIVGADGRVLFHNVPPGAISVEIWHPYLKAPGNRMLRPTVLVEGAMRRESFTVALRSPPKPPAIADY